MVHVRNDHLRFQHAGGEVALVTMGNVEQTEAFRNRYDLPFLCLADPERVSYRAYAVPRGRIGQIAGPVVWGSGFKSFLHKGAGIPIGDVRQMPAAFVIDSSGRIRYLHYATNAAQHPPHVEINEVLDFLG